MTSRPTNADAGMPNLNPHTHPERILVSSSAVSAQMNEMDVLYKIKLEDMDEALTETVISPWADMVPYGKSGQMPIATPPTQMDSNVVKDIPLTASKAATSKHSSSLVKNAGKNLKEKRVKPANINDQDQRNLARLNCKLVIKARKDKEAFQLKYAELESEFAQYKADTIKSLEKKDELIRSLKGEIEYYQSIGQPSASFTAGITESAPADNENPETDNAAAPMSIESSNSPTRADQQASSSSLTHVQSELVPLKVGDRFACPWPECNKNFKVMLVCKNHIHTHTGEKPYKCAECPTTMTFINARKMREHFMELHPAILPFACSQCVKRFSTINKLNTHVRTHTGEKPLGCSDCDETFADGGALSKHRRKQHTGNLHTCGHCEKEFVYKCRMEDHVRAKHTKEKPYSCEVCPEAYASKGALRMHRNASHK